MDHTGVNRLEQRVIVVGGGPVGLLSALGIAQSGVATVLVTPDPPSAGTASEARTAALFTPSLLLLERLGIWADCAPTSEPLKAIRMIDDRGSLLRAPEVTFQASELGCEAFGYNVPNAALSAAARQALAQNPGDLTWISGHTVSDVRPADDHIEVTLDDGRLVRGALVVGADGRQSVCRSGAGIGEQFHTYDQVAVTASFTHQRPHHGISTEFHGPAGPCTTVPLPGRASSLVWVERPGIASRLLALDDAGFCQALETRLQGLLGTVLSVTARGRFPLTWIKAETTAARRVMLVGEAAHVMPPIGAQGLNLGLRDVGFVIDCVRDAHSRQQDVGSVETVSAYHTSRATDITMRMTAIDALNQSLLTDLTGVHLARGLGLQLVARSRWMRRTLMGTGMSTNAALPRLMQAQA